MPQAQGTGNACCIICTPTILGGRMLREARDGHDDTDSTMVRFRHAQHTLLKEIDSGHLTQGQCIALLYDLQMLEKTHAQQHLVGGFEIRQYARPDIA